MLAAMSVKKFKFGFWDHMLEGEKSHKLSFELHIGVLTYTYLCVYTWGRIWHYIR